MISFFDVIKKWGGEEEDNDPAATSELSSTDRVSQEREPVIHIGRGWGKTTKLETEKE